MKITEKLVEFLKTHFPKIFTYFVKRFIKIVQKNHWPGCTLLAYRQMSDIQNLANFKYGSIHIWQLCVFISLRKHNLKTLVISQYISQCFRRKSIYWRLLGSLLVTCEGTKPLKPNNFFKFPTLPPPIKKEKSLYWLTSLDT